MGRNSLGGTRVVRERMEGGRVARWSWRPFSDPSSHREHRGNGNEEESQNYRCFPGPQCIKDCQLRLAESSVQCGKLSLTIHVLRWDGTRPLWAPWSNVGHPLLCLYKCGCSCRHTRTRARSARGRSAHHRGRAGISVCCFLGLKPLNYLECSM